MRVLIAVDGSTGAFAAVSQVGQVLATGKDEVALYCSPPEFRPAGSIDPSLLARARQSLTEAIFEESRKRLPPALQASAHTIVGERDPRLGILVAAEKWGAQVVGVGARGLGPMERLLLGSVSRAVVHGAKIPVWVARDKSFAPQRPPNVLLACAHSELDRQAAELVGKFTWPPGTSFSTISVLGSIFSGRVPEWLQKPARSPEVEIMAQAWAHEHDDDLRACRTRLEEFARSLPTALPGCRSVVAEGEPAREILSTISREKIDLVVMGCHRKRSFVGTILGSTSEAVLNHAECSVLAVPLEQAA